MLLYRDNTDYEIQKYLRKKQKHVTDVPVFSAIQKLTVGTAVCHVNSSFLTKVAVHMKS